MEPIQNDCSILNQRSQVIRNENFWAMVSLMFSAVASEWSKLSAKDFLASTHFCKSGASIVVAVFGRCPIKSFSLHKASMRQLSTATVRSKASMRQLYSSNTLVTLSSHGTPRYETVMCFFWMDLPGSMSSNFISFKNAARFCCRMSTVKFLPARTFTTRSTFAVVLPMSN